MIKTTIVGLGDSLTYGYGVDTTVGFMDRLEQYMPLYYPSISWNITNSGVNGDTSREALLRLRRDVLLHNPNLVLILLGTNDSSLSDTQFRPPNEFEANLHSIITQIKKHNNRTGLNHCIPIPVLITAPPVVEEVAAPFNTNARVEHYNAITRHLAACLHCPLIDFYPYLLEESNGDYAHFFQSDGLHLATPGYDCLYDCVFSGLSRLITYEGILKEYDIISYDDFS